MTTFEQGVPRHDELPLRVWWLERFKNTIEDWRRQVDKDRAKVELQLDQVVSDMRTLKRIAISLLISVVTGSTAITLAVILSTRGH